MAEKVKVQWNERYSFTRLREIDDEIMELREERRQIKKDIKIQNE